MEELIKQLSEWREAIRGRLRAIDEMLPSWWQRALVVVLIAGAIVLPLFFIRASGFIDATIKSLAFVVMALGLNVVVGFAGLLDLGYVAFYAIGAYCLGWFGSYFFATAHAHVLSSPQVAQAAGIHLNFVLIAIAAAAICAILGVFIGLPTLRLRGDYIAIVTLAFGEIIGTVAVNGQDIHLPGGIGTLTAGNIGISAPDVPYFPNFHFLFFNGTFSPLDLRPWYWLILAIVLLVLFVNIRVRDSRLGRAWVALREDEVAAVSMGIPLVRTKLLAYAMGAAFGGISGAFLGAYYGTVNAGQFQFSFSIFVLAMIIVGGLGSIWGAVLGALLLSYINFYFIPDVFNSLPHTFGLTFSLTDLSYGIFGFLLVLVMVLRPQGLFPERRRSLELAEAIGPSDVDEGMLEKVD
jgi:branched-chain amino acid transport system permease protein